VAAPEDQDFHTVMAKKKKELIVVISVGSAATSAIAATGFEPVTLGL
jgi:hypothetical protein